MKRTQIYLDNEISTILKRESKTLRKTISEIIRDSVREKYRADVYALKEHMNSVFGIWRNRKIEPETYITDMRKDRKI